MRPPHLLVVSFGYEPLEHVIAVRATRMATELTALGWDVTGLTFDWTTPPARRVATVASAVASALESASPRRLAIDGRIIAPTYDPAAMAQGREPESFDPLPRKLRTAINTIGWGPFPRWARLAFEAAIRLHGERPIDLVWAIHGDDSCHAIADRLSRNQGIPWVADFKDPWDYFHSPLGLPLQRWATARRLRGATAVTETCAAQADRDAADFGVKPEVVYSGYDAALMASVTPERPSDGFCVSYLGGLSAQHDTTLLPGVLRELSRRGLLTQLPFALHYFGRDATSLRDKLEEAGCGSLLHESPWVARARSFALMRGSDLLLMFPSRLRSSSLVGVKELEYFASGTPVLILGRPLDEMQRVVAGCPQVHVALDVGSAVEAVARAAASWSREDRPARTVNESVLREFAWSEQAGRLSEILRRALR
jgi:glycosyltransferase involved in cell wall biosynthesis